MQKFSKKKRPVLLNVLFWFCFMLGMGFSVVLGCSDDPNTEPTVTDFCDLVGEKCAKETKESCLKSINDHFKMLELPDISGAITCVKNKSTCENMPTDCTELMGKFQ